MRHTTRLIRTAAGAALVVGLAGCGLLEDDKVTVEDTYGLQMVEHDDAPMTTAVPGAPTTAPPATTAPVVTTTTMAPEDVAALRERFIEAGNELCYDEYDQTGRQMRVDPRATRAAAFAFFRDMRDSMRRVQSGLRRLDPPPGDEATIDWITASYDPLLALLDPLLARGGFLDEAERANFVATWDPLLDNLDAAAGGYGLTECTTAV